MAQWSPHTSMASTPLPTPSPLSQTEHEEKLDFGPMVIPEPPNRKVNRSIPTRAAPSAREAVFLAERMLRFERQSCN